jgi:V/A-type H+-transporting ATPase subunit I
MARSERALPVRMRRVAVIILRERVREALVTLAEAGTLDLAGPLGSGDGPALETLRRLESRRAAAARPSPALARRAPDIQRLERAGARDVLAGEVELDRRRSSSVSHGSFALFVGWVPAPELGRLAERLRPLGGELLELPSPRGQMPPTLLAPSAAATPFRPLLDTYGAVPYEDLDPTAFVTLTYCLMFGMMFGDVGDGILVVLAALALRRTRRPRLARLRKAWPMIAAPGAAAVVFGALYGEFFGPTRLLPTLWLAPLDSPTDLLAAAIAIGGGLLVAGHLLGIVNRWREGGVALAMTAVSGVPGLSLLAGGALAGLGVLDHIGVLRAVGLGLVAAAVILLAVGLRQEAGGGGAGLGEVAVGLFDAVMRTFSNVFSFSRLAAFGLTHAALAKVVLDAAGGLTGTVGGDLGAVAVFAVGGAAAFALEALVAAVQALRLEYYELFSRLFTLEGRPFRPWSLPLTSIEEA